MFRAIATLLLAIHGLLAGWAALRNSPTVDEVNHLPAGLSYLERGTFEIYPHNPPLVKVLCALPLYAAGVEADYRHAWLWAKERGFPVSHSAFARNFQEAQRAPEGRYRTLFVVARIVAILLALGGGVVVLLFSRDLFGERGALVSLAAWTFCPNLLAHDGLVTTDGATTAAAIAAMYLFRRWLRAPTLSGAIVTGAGLGGALLVKFSLLLLVPLWIFFAAWTCIAPSRPAGGDSRRRRVGVGLALALATALVVVNAGYLFEGTGKRLGDYEFISPALSRTRSDGASPYAPEYALHRLHEERQNRFQGTLLARLPVPLPERFVQGFDLQSFEANTGLEAGGYPVYLRGELRYTGWWYYYLYCLGVKLPPGTLALLAWTLLVLVLHPPSRLAPLDEAFLWLPPLSYLAAFSFGTDIDLGVRYVLPCLPFAMVAMGRLARVRARPQGIAAVLGLAPLTERRWHRWLLVGLLALNLASALRIAPHYLAYFNLFAGGPAHGHEHLIDSNLDWGQDLLELKKSLDRRGHRGPLPCALFGNLDPTLFGIEPALIARDPKTLPPGGRVDGEPRRLAPGLHAVSVNYVMGLPYRWLHRGEWFHAREGAYAWFQRLAPVERVGYSIWLYELSPADCSRLELELGL